VKSIVLALCRLAVGALFLYAASTKVPDMAKFAEEVANYRLLPAALVPVVAAVVIGLEIVAGLALVSGIAARPAAVAVSGLLVVFTVGIAQALARGIDLRCGCFGTEEAATWWTVVRDLAILAPALAVAILGPGRLLPRGAPRGEPGEPGRPVEAP
jgi:putative oxidoreductase